MFRKRLLALLLGLLLAIGVTGFSAASPAFAAGCWDSSCNGQDPNAEGCAGDATDASTHGIYYNGTYLGNLRLRYSGACFAYWPRWDPSGTSYNVQMSVWHPGSPSVVSGSGHSQFYGPMLGRSGGQTCYGVQVYDWLYNWKEWVFAGCVN